jgi:CheY-like chemotaxis protein
MQDEAGDLMASLPFLRRYAWALTGSPVRGDTLVSEALQRHATDPAVAPAIAPVAAFVPTRRAAPAGLYALLNSLADETLPRDASAGQGWGHASGPGPAPPLSGDPLVRALGGLPEPDRRLYLLVTLEGLPLAEASAILGLAPETTAARLTEARTTLRRQLQATVLVVEDDAIIAFELIEIIHAMGHAVCGIASTMATALALAAAHRPTLALLDIRLAGGDNGLEVARALRRQRSMPIILVTAFPADAARSGLEELGPVIAKPFSHQQIEQAITCAVYNGHAATPSTPTPPAR